jgi:hypothetical protein
MRAAGVNQSGRKKVWRAKALIELHRKSVFCSRPTSTSLSRRGSSALKTMAACWFQRSYRQATARCSGCRRSCGGNRMPASNATSRSTASRSTFRRSEMGAPQATGLAVSRGLLDQRRVPIEKFQARVFKKRMVRSSEIQCGLSKNTPLSVSTLNSRSIRRRRQHQIHRRWRQTKHWHQPSP